MKNKDSEKNKPNKSFIKNNLNLLIICLLISTLSVFALIAFKLHKSNCNSNTVNKVNDSAVKDGALSFETAEEIKKRLEKETEDSQVRLKINTNPIFENGNSEGNLLIENYKDNKYYFSVEITIEDSGETIYKSSILKPLQYIDTDKLLKTLKKGEYPCIALFTVYDENNNILNRIGAKINISILS